MNVKQFTCPDCEGVGEAVDTFSVPVEFDLMTGQPVQWFLAATKYRADGKPRFRRDGHWYDPGQTCGRCKGRGRVVEMVCGVN